VRLVGYKEYQQARAKDIKRKTVENEVETVATNDRTSEEAMVVDVATTEEQVTPGTVTTEEPNIVIVLVAPTVFALSPVLEEEEEEEEEPLKRTRISRPSGTGRVTKARRVSSVPSRPLIL